MTRLNESIEVVADRVTRNVERMVELSEGPQLEAAKREQGDILQQLVVDGVGLFVRLVRASEKLAAK